MTNLIIDPTVSLVRGYNSTVTFTFNLNHVGTTGDIEATSSGNNFLAGCYLSQTDASSLTANADGSSVFTGSTTAHAQGIDIQDSQLARGLSVGGSLLFSGQVRLRRALYDCLSYVQVMYVYMCVTPRDIHALADWL